MRSIQKSRKAVLFKKYHRPAVEDDHIEKEPRKVKELREKELRVKKLRKEKELREKELREKKLRVKKLREKAEKEKARETPPHQSRKRASVPLVVAVMKS